MIPPPKLPASQSVASHPRRRRYVPSVDVRCACVCASMAASPRRPPIASNNVGEPHETTRNTRVWRWIAIKHHRNRHSQASNRPFTGYSHKSRLLPAPDSAKMQANGGFHLTPIPSPKVKIPYY